MPNFVDAFEVFGPKIEEFKPETKRYGQIKEWFEKLYNETDDGGTIILNILEFEEYVLSLKNKVFEPNACRESASYDALEHYLNIYADEDKKDYFTEDYPETHNAEVNRVIENANRWNVKLYKIEELWEYMKADEV